MCSVVAFSTAPALRGRWPHAAGPGGAVCGQSGRQRGAAWCSAAVGRTSELRAVIERVAGAERGLFGVPRGARAELDALIRAVEAECPTAVPTADCARAVAGRWRLLYTTLTILGRRRVALAIATSTKPGFVRIAEITQEIVPVDGDAGRSVNVVHLDLLTGGSGRFTLEAKYRAVSPRRVDIALADSVLEPEKLRALLGDNVELLTEVFNPEGFLEISYLDDEFRVGRDHNGNVFVLERIVGDDNV